VNPYENLTPVSSGKQWLNPAALLTPAAYTYGNESRDDLVGPGYTDVDISAYKNFPFLESRSVQFRAEFFNILNHSNYALPNTSVATGTFGLITSTFGQGRQIQFAVKVLF
jgi:hypothetical protein